MLLGRYAAAGGCARVDSLVVCVLMLVIDLSIVVISGVSYSIVSCDGLGSSEASVQLYW